MRPGECVGLVGPNGAGKSTVMGLGLGYLRPSAGRVRVGGLPPRRYVRTRGVSHLPETFSPPGRVRARGLLRRLALLDGLGRRGARERAEEALARCGLEGAGARRVRELSRGKRQRLGVAQLLVRPRAVVLMDEPWGGLDPEGRSRLRRLTAELRRGRRTPAVLVASHDLSQVARVADRAVVLVGGRAAERVPLEGATDGERLERAILEAEGAAVLRRGGRSSRPRAGPGAGGSG